jgi:hypothetical protein
MTTVIDSPGLAKPSADDSARNLRSLRNELVRVRRRHKHAKEKLAGLRSLKDDLPRYLQPGDYEFLEERLEREVERRPQ